MIRSDGDMAKEKVLLNRSFCVNLTNSEVPEGNNFITFYGMALITVYINTSVLRIFCC